MKKYDMFGHLFISGIIVSLMLLLIFCQTSLSLPV